MGEIMDSIDRVFRTINFQKPDKYPIMFNILPGAWAKYGRKLYSIIKNYSKHLFDELEDNELKNWRSSSPTINTIAGIGKDNEFILNDDFAFITPRSYMYGRAGFKGEQSDEWGCIWRRADEDIIGIPVFHPLSKLIQNDDIDKLGNYDFPNPNAHWRFDTPFLEEQSRFSNKYKKYLFGYVGNFFELLQCLLGYENLMILLYSEPKKIEELISKIVHYNIETLKKLSNYDIQGISFEDDWGTQNDLMIDPEMWRKYFKPAYKKLIDEAKKRDLHVDFHSDGNIIKIVDDLIEIGVDVLNPQISAMDIKKLSIVCRGKVCIRTDIDRQYLLQFGTRHEVREYVKKIVELLGTKNGGLILYAEINHDAKLANIKELFKSFSELESLFNNG